MKYIAYYDIPENKDENRGYVLSATNKIDYICSVLNKIGEKVDVISASGTLGKKFCKGKKIDLKNGNTLKLFSSVGRGNKIKNALSAWLLKLNMFFYLLKNTKKGEKIIVYHSLGYYGMIKLLKKLKKINLILEVEEIYADVIGNSKIRNKELEFFKIADAYIFPTVLLNDLINKSGKPFVVIHGTYQVEEDRKVSFNDDKIHVVYAGTFDPRKGGVQAAIKSANFLPNNYLVHILGFGNDKDVSAVKMLVEETKNVIFEGLLSGEEYIRFLQKCHIGLSTQNPEGVYNDTSFPCKILSYMANGLRVVSVRIPVIDTSAVGEAVYYYEKQTPEEITKAIMSINLNNDYDGKQIINLLDEIFTDDFGRLLEAI